MFNVFIFLYIEYIKINNQSIFNSIQEYGNNVKIDHSHKYVANVIEQLAHQVNKEDNKDQNIQIHIFFSKTEKYLNLKTTVDINNQKKIELIKSRNKFIIENISQKFHFNIHLSVKNSKKQNNKIQKIIQIHMEKYDLNNNFKFQKNIFIGIN